MVNLLTVMDPQHSIREYLKEADIPAPGPLVLMDVEDGVRRIAQYLGQPLPKEAHYIEQLWLRVDPAPTEPPEGWQPGDGLPPWVGGPPPWGGGKPPWAGGPKGKWAFVWVPGVGKKWIKLESPSKPGG